MMKTTIKKWGNSLGVRIPNMIAQELQLEDGTQVEIARKAEHIVIMLGNEARLMKKLELVNRDNLHGEIDTGQPVGNEEW